VSIVDVVVDARYGMVGQESVTSGATDVDFWLSISTDTCSTGSRSLHPYSYFPNPAAAGVTDTVV
jgi:hypothetical protein